MAIFSFSPALSCCFSHWAVDSVSSKVVWWLEKLQDPQKLGVHQKMQFSVQINLSVRKPCTLRGGSPSGDGWGPVLIFAQPSFYLPFFPFLTAITTLYTGSSVVFCLCLTQLRCSLLTLPTSHQVQGHVQVSRQRAVIRCVACVPFCLLRCTPSGLSCSFALTELTGGLTEEFYHHPFSLPLLFLPLSHSLCLSLSMFLFSLASIGNLTGLFSSVLSHRWNAQAEEVLWQTSCVCVWCV